MLIPAYHVRVIAIPPPFGVGKSCRLLSFGITVILFLTAYCIISMVRKYETIPRERMMKVISRIFTMIRL
jgi:hypothetical protein